MSIHHPVALQSEGLQTRAWFIDASRARMAFPICNQMNELTTTLAWASLPPAGLKPRFCHACSRMAEAGSALAAVRFGSVQAHARSSSSLRNGGLFGFLWIRNSAESVRVAVVGPQVQVGFEGAAELELSSAGIHNWISV